MTDLCQPPEELRGVIRPHYVAKDARVIIAEWDGEFWCRYGTCILPSRVHQEGWRYLGPVPTHAEWTAAQAEITALRARIATQIPALHQCVAERDGEIERLRAQLADADATIQHLNSGAELQAIMEAHNKALARIAELEAQAAMTDELKPCPFCGSDPYLYISPSSGECWATCSACGATGPIGDEEADDNFAISGWNTRVSEMSK